MYSFIPPTDPTPQQIQLIRSMIRGTGTKKQEKLLEKLLPTPPDSSDAFILKPAYDWVTEAQKEAPDDMLFGDFWYEGELCILFADTNVGKSILAVQIGDAISRGDITSSLPPVSSSPQVRANSTVSAEAERRLIRPIGPQNVLYFDFELSAKQFGRRYSNDANGAYRFAPSFYRIALNPKASGDHKFKTFADYLENALENLLLTTRARTVIIDNLTCLRTGTEAAAGAILLMRNLRRLKQKYGLSLLVLAHTPKRNAARPLTGNDLQGSKMLLNFADSAFAIGQSQTRKGLCYLKQIKQRSTGQQYGADNICLCRIAKPANFLKFQFEGQGAEAEHLLPLLQQQRAGTETRIQTLRGQGRSLRHIAAETGLPLTTVARMLKKMSQAEAPEAPRAEPSAASPVIPAADPPQPPISASPPGSPPPAAPPIATQPLIPEKEDIIVATHHPGDAGTKPAHQQELTEPPAQTCHHPPACAQIEAVRATLNPASTVDWRAALCAP